MRRCNVCKQEQPLDNFHNCKRFPLGKVYTCKPCAKLKSRWWSLDNPELKKKQYQKDYLQNKQGYIERARKTDRRLRSATPKWLTQNQRDEIDQFYWLTYDLRRVSGEYYHVDHIVPLQGKNVCGLHVPWNLQVLPRDLNLLKSNAYPVGVHEDIDNGSKRPAHDGRYQRYRH